MRPAAHGARRRGEGDPARPLEETGGELEAGVLLAEDEETLAGIRLGGPGVGIVDGQLDAGRHVGSVPGAGLRIPRPRRALIALRTGVPVVPVAISGTEYIRNLKWSFFHHPKILITIGKPINPPARDGKPTKEQRNKLCNDIMYEIAELLPEKYRGFYDREKTTEN